MHGLMSIMLLMILSGPVAFGRTVKPGDQPDWVRDYTIINPFLSCEPKDGCVELPDVPYAWRFVPEFMGWRKFTPFGAIRKDWNDYWLAKKRVWWDYTFDLPGSRGFGRYSYNGWNYYNNSFNQW